MHVYMYRFYKREPGGLGGLCTNGLHCGAWANFTGSP